MQTKPRWMKMLFHLFVVNYKNLWTDSLSDPTLERANEYLWSTMMKDYPEPMIMEAGLKAIEAYHYPPSIQQFLEILKAMQRNEKMESDYLKRLNYDQEKKRSAPPSPLLAEYMRNNPVKEDDLFKQIFAKYRGDELGREVIKAIKNKLGKQYAKC